MQTFFRCDEIYREFTRIEMRRQERSRERRMVIITSPERSDGGGVEKREDLGEAERKIEARKCDRIFLSSAPIKAEMVPFQGLQGDQVSLTFLSLPLSLSAVDNDQPLLFTRL